MYNSTTHDIDDAKFETRVLLSRSQITHGDHPLSLGKSSIWNQFFQVHYRYLAYFFAVDKGNGAMTNGSTIMLDRVLDLLSRRWDRINGAQALKLLSRELNYRTCFRLLDPFLRKSSEMHRNCLVMKSLRQSENLQIDWHHQSLV
ncbi:hypothetical protein RJT34_18809 [Clitoria ternatea]|uniref:Maturase K n=1 Tax=Clitoria ternatea TaxID=43366 RepID=A0AAN9P2Q8_CLITE